MKDMGDIYSREKMGDRNTGMFGLNMRQSRISVKKMERISKSLQRYADGIQAVEKSMGIGSSSIETIGRTARRSEGQIRELARKIRYYGAVLENCARAYQRCEDNISGYYYVGSGSPVIIQTIELTELEERVHGLGEIKF